MGTGIITTAVLLVIGYVIVSRIMGFAFRLVVPLILIMLLGGAGVISDLVPERAPDPYAADRDISYGPAQHRTGHDIGDLRLRDLGDMAMRAVRSVLQGAIALLDQVTEPEPASEPYRPGGPRHSREGEHRDLPPSDDRTGWQAAPPDRW